jgi:hypothetical protein
VTGSEFASACPRSRPLIEYRVYKLDVSGRIAFVPDIILCADDDAAIFGARPYADGHTLEIWAGTRRVAIVPPDRGR